eukprot:Amastigsp_a177868_6.p3 type:complete len:150 gc:universal Amastigsp_a177868_6:966-517(-)
MRVRRSSRQPTLRIVAQQRGQKRHSFGRGVGKKGRKALRRHVRKAHFAKVRKGAEPRPFALSRCSQDSEHSKELVDVRLAHKQRPHVQHLTKDAASGPNVDRKAVHSRAKEQLGRSIPPSSDLRRQQSRARVRACAQLCDWRLRALRRE